MSVSMHSYKLPRGLTRKNVSRILNRNADVQYEEFGAATRNLAKLVSKVETILEDNGDLLSEFQAAMSVHLGRIRDECAKALESYKESGNSMTENVNNANKVNSANSIDDLLGKLGALTF